MTHHTTLLSKLVLFPVLAASLHAATITTHPASQTVAQGTGASLAVTATSAGSMTYQWQKDGVDIPNATATTFSIASTQPWHIGDYRVKVTDTGGTVTSSVATLALTGSNTALWRGLVGYYPFNGTANDSSVFGANGVPQNSTSASDRFGVTGRAWNFASDVNSRINIAKNAQHNFTAGMTISLWVQINQSWSYHNESLIWDRPNSQPYGFELAVNQDNSSYGAGKYSLGNGMTVFSDTGNVFWTGPVVAFDQIARWNMITPTISGTSCRLYVNGVPVAYAIGGTQLANSPADLIIGGSSNPVSGAYNRNVDDVRIYNRGMTNLEVAALYNLEDPDTDGDGIRDRYETNTGTFVSPTNSGTNPAAADTDGDGFQDGFELLYGSNPTVTASVPAAIPTMLPAVQFQFGAANSVSYRIESSTDLTNWNIVEDNIIGSGASVVRYYPTDGITRQFYRVMKN